MKSDFEERRERRIERYEERAGKAKQESDAAFARANELSSHIPMGQPILVGHHSEKRHRSHLKRIHGQMDKGVELNRKANYYEDRAEAAKNNKAIFSDDPNAEEKLEDKIERLEQRQTLMREANKAIRKNDDEKLRDLGFTDSGIEKLKTPDFMGRVGFANYQLTNNNANIRRLKERLAQIKKQNEAKTEEITIGKIRIVQNVDENRTQIFFPGKPDEAIRAKLKSHGFRWSPSEGAWQRHLSDGALYWAKKIAEEIGGSNET